MIKFIRAHLVWKVFLSYLMVVLVGCAVLAIAMSLSAPVAFNRHMAGMSAMMGGNSPMMGGSPWMDNNGRARSAASDLFTGYESAITEALSLATLTALIAAIIASYFISRQVVEPIQQMMRISHRIAEGEYEERLKISPQVHPDFMDELEQLALSFNQMANKLEKTENTRRQLIGDVSHELRTPLTAIEGYMEGLIDGVLPASVDTYQLVRTEADRLQRLVNDLQELSRVESGACVLNPSIVPVIDLVDMTIDRLSRQYEEKGITLEKDVETDISPVKADKDRVLQILINLTGNALQYTPGGGRVVIKTRQTSSGEVLFQVIDNGIGIPQDQLSMIFDRFYRADKSRARASGGSGIGLTIARALVKMQGGRIWAESAGTGQGSVFSFTLPVAPLNPSNL